MSEKKQNETAKNWVDRLLNNKIALVLLFCAGAKQKNQGNFVV